MEDEQDGTTDQGSNDQSQADGGNGSGDGQEQDTNASPELRRARSDAAKYRGQLRDVQSQLKELQSKQQEADDAKKSEVERLTERTAALETEVRNRDDRIRSLALEGAVLKQATTKGIVDPDAAWRLLDADAVEYDDTGKPTNIEDLLDSLVEARPYLKGKSSSGEKKPKDDTSTTNPDGTKKRPLTIEDVNKMTDDEINARWDEVQKVLASSGR